jgi:hypothetical protein
MRSNSVAIVSTAYDRDRAEEPREDPEGTVDRGPPRAGRQKVGLQQHLTGGLEPGLRHHHVARAGGQHVGHVEATRALQHRGDALLEQQSLDELGLGLVASAHHAGQRALGVLRLDLAGARMAFGDRLVDARGTGVDQRHPARRAEALVEPVRRSATRADERLSQGRPAPR